jgi:amino acid permease
VKFSPVFIFAFTFDYNYVTMYPIYTVDGVSHTRKMLKILIRNLN